MEGGRCPSRQIVELHVRLEEDGMVIPNRLPISVVEKPVGAKVVKEVRFFLRFILETIGQ